MSGTLVLFLGNDPRWLRIQEGGVVARGQGRELPSSSEERVVAIAPASEITIHQAALPDLSERQATAAARLMIAENSIGGAEALHAAAGPIGADGLRTLVAIDRGRMATHLAALASDGIDPDAMLAAPLLMPAPETGFVRALLGGEVVVRGVDSAFVDDPVLTPLLAPEGARDLDADETDRAVTDAVAFQMVDLRQGDFARSRRIALDWSHLRLIAALVAATLVALLVLQIAHVVALQRAASRIETANATIARHMLPGETAVTDARTQLDARIAAVRGPGGGVLPLVRPLAAAIAASPGVELTALNFDESGAVRASVRGSGAGDLAAVQSRLVAGNLDVAVGPVVMTAGRPMQELTVRVR